MADSSSSSSSSMRRWKYDVFLSFRGEDTRGNFTDHLYQAFTLKGISTFRDENEIDEGADISSELLAAIEESRFAVVVVSENYAESRWCLAELVKIFECKEQLGMNVVPIFYKVDPSNVRNQRETFAKAFVKHEERFGEDDLKVRQWRQVLSQIANLKAWVSYDWSHESEMIAKISEAIWKRIKPALILTREDQLVGITSKLNKLSSLLNPNSDNDVIFIGIYGMGGIGKTTIARVCYERIRDEFKVHCFLDDVREKFKTSGLPYLQSKLLSRAFPTKKRDVGDAQEGIALIKKTIFQKKTLLVLDDVDDIDQLMGLIPDKDFFGYGSTIIITTRNADLLSLFGVKRVFKMEELEYEEALQLLSLNAFMERCPKEGYMGHSDRIVKLVGGHPLALKLLGTSLKNKNSDVWNCVIEEIQGGGNIDDKIFKCLKVSYDGLDDWEKKIFLDVACFFKGKRRDLVEEILDGCGFYARRRVELLIQKSLITLSDDYKLQIHDLLQEMGRKIVLKKPIQDRLWCHKDIKSVVSEASIQTMILKMTRNVVEIPTLFSRMHQLRLLNFHNVRLKNHLEYCIPDELRYLKWKGYPLESLPMCSEENKLIKLHMCHSNLKQFWKEGKLLERLKYIKLSHSQKLSKTPDFAQLPNLQRLELKGCTSLINIHPSIFVAKRLVFLCLEDCINLTNLPRQITIEVLEVLILSGCSKLKKIPELTGNVDRLLQLHLDDTSIADLPSSVGSLNCLTVLSLRNCRKLVSIPAIDKLKSLQNLDLSGCSKLENLTTKSDDSECLELDVRGTARRRGDDDNRAGYMIIKRMILSFCKAPVSGVFGIPSLSSLYSLTKLNMSDCNLKKIPEGIECLTLLIELNLDGNNFCELPTSLGRLLNLKRLNISGCKKLVRFPQLPPKIVRLTSKDCVSLEHVPDISKVDHSYFMRELNLLNCRQFAGNKQLHSMVTSWMEKMFFRKGEFNIMIPGSEIPDWFTTTKMGSSISIEWDPNAQNPDLDVFALGVVCGPTSRNTAIAVADTTVSFGILASMAVKNSGDLVSDKKRILVNGFSVVRMRTKLDHIWMFLLSRSKSQLSKIKKRREIEFRFWIEINHHRYDPSIIELKKCGVRLISMEGEKEAMKQYASHVMMTNRMLMLNNAI